MQQMVMGTDSGGHSIHERDVFRLSLERTRVVSLSVYTLIRGLDYDNDYDYD